MGEGLDVPWPGPPNGHSSFTCNNNKASSIPTTDRGFAKQFLWRIVCYFPFIHVCPCTFTLLQFSQNQWEAKRPVEQIHGEDLRKNRTPQDQGGEAGRRPESNQIPRRIGLITCTTSSGVRDMVELSFIRFLCESHAHTVALTRRTHFAITAKPPRYSTMLVSFQQDDCKNRGYLHETRGKLQIE